MSTKRKYHDNREDVQKVWNDSKHPLIKAKGTIGLGDCMAALNIAHFRSFIWQKKVILENHWYHDEDYQYHFEDPETIVEKFDYFAKFYEPANVEIKHVFNSPNKGLYKQRYQHHRGIIKDQDYRAWSFRKEMVLKEPIKNKIVMWRQTFNADIPKNYKRIFDNDGWNTVAQSLRNQGYTIAEIDYRTPISEVMYHISTCEATVGYEGMFHYVAKNFWKPMIIFTRDNISKLHTPHALLFARALKRQFDVTCLDDFPSVLDEAKSMINKPYKNMILGMK